MYESFFALKEKPFALTPNPRFLFLSKTHNEVYAHLIFGIENRAGFVEVTGEVGTGKTTILRTLLSHLDEKKYRVALIFNPKLTAFELLRNINHEFGIADDGQSLPDLIKSLNEFLLSENEAGRTPILVIDEAQNLSGEVLEQIRLLSNLETEEDKLIQIVLVGQPELRRHLGDHSLRQLNQRIAVRYQLRPLNSDEASSYILHRLKIAGRLDSNIFSGAALKKIYKLSGGVPRRINLISDRAMLTAFTEERGTVTVKDVNQAVMELDGLGEGRVSTSQLPWQYIGGAAMLATCVLAVFFMLSPSALTTADEVPKQSMVAVSPKLSEGLAKTVRQVEAPEANNPGPESIISSCNALLNLWDARLLDTSATSSGIDIDSEFADRGFKIVSLAGEVETIQKYNLPFLLPLSQAQGGGYIAVQRALGPRSWSVAPTYKGKKTLTTEQLNDLSLQMAIIPWVDFASIGYVAVPGTNGENVRRLQFLLGLAGCPDVPTNGRYGRKTIDCVKQFQRDQGLVVDGLVGPRTLILLYQFAGAYDMPSFS
jgi:general secretion pathway protein A